MEQEQQDQRGLLANGSHLHIAMLRKWSGLTQKEAASLLMLYTGHAYGFEAVSRHEAHTHAFRMPPPEALKAYSNIFKIPIQYLYCDLIDEDKLRLFWLRERGLENGHGE